MPVLYEIFQVPPSMAMHCKQCQLPNEFSALAQLVYLRKSESMSGHVPVLLMCCDIPLCVAFVDYEKAFDSVQTQAILTS